MSNRFVNGRELKSESFEFCTELVAYVNKEHIESDDIQFITQMNGNNWVLLYWK